VAGSVDGGGYDVMVDCYHGNDDGTSAGPTKDQRGFEQEQKLHSESIFKADKRYYLDLKENHRGRFLKVDIVGIEA